MMVDSQSLMISAAIIVGASILKKISDIAVNWAISKYANPTARAAIKTTLIRYIIAPAIDLAPLLVITWAIRRRFGDAPLTGADAFDLAVLSSFLGMFLYSLIERVSRHMDAPRAGTRE